MKKLKLNLDDLKVESFDTTPSQLGRRTGTIFGYGETLICETHTGCFSDNPFCPETTEDQIRCDIETFGYECSQLETCMC